MAKSLDTLVEDVARRFGRVLKGTTSAVGSVNTLIDIDGLIQPNNYWVNYYLRILSGALAGQERLITAHTQLTATLNLSPDLPSAIGANEQFFISVQQRDDYVAAIQGAVNAAGSDWITIVEDESQKLTIAQEYPLPAGTLYLIGVYVGANGYWELFTEYEVHGTAGAYTMLIRRWPDAPLLQIPPVVNISQLDMRLVYATLPGVPSDGADTLGMGNMYEREATEFVTNYALYLLHQMVISRNPTGEAARTHLTLSDRVFSEAMRIREKRTPQYVVRRNQSMPRPRFVQ